MDSEAPLDLTRTESQVEVYDMDAEPVEITKDEVEEVRVALMARGLRRKGRVRQVLS